MTGTRLATLILSVWVDPQLSTAKRQQRTQAFSSHMAHASLERQLAAAQTAKLELETKLREKELLVERLEGDRRWLAEREQEEKEEKQVSCARGRFVPPNMACLMLAPLTASPSRNGTEEGPEHD